METRRRGDMATFLLCSLSPCLLVSMSGWLLASALAYQDPPADPVKAADELLAKRFAGDKPGAAVLIVHDGKVALQKGYGLADVDAKTSITPQTQFDLASLAKQFTATAVMLLADRGQLGFDDDVRKLLP